MTPQELVEAALALCREEFGAIVTVTVSSRADLRWACSTLTTNGESVTTTLSVLVFHRDEHGTSVASATCSRPDRAAIADTVEAARLSARQSTPADDAFDLIGAQGSACIDWAESAPRTSGAALHTTTRQLGDVLASTGSAGIELFGYAEHTLETVWLGSSTGLRLRHVQPAGRCEITAKSHGRQRSAWWGVATDDFADVDLSQAEGTLRRGLGWQARQWDIQPGRHRCVLTPGAVGDLMVDLWWSLSARAATEGRSVFSAPDGATRIGERLTDAPIALVSAPHDTEIAASPWLCTSASSDLSSVFDNGMSTGRTAWIDGGILGHLMAPRAQARRSGLPAVASADNLRLESSTGAGELDDLVGRIEDGLLITCLWYNRLVDPQTLLLTGLTRDGVYVIRDGEVIGATSNFRFNDSPVSMLGRLGAVGRSSRTLPREMGDYAPRVAMPAVCVEDFNLSTVSDAR